VKCAGVLVAIVIAAVSAAPARAAQLSGGVFLMPVDTTFQSYGEAEYLNDLNARVSDAVLTGTHSVRGPQVFEAGVQATGLYAYTLAGPAVPGACYGTTLYVIGDVPSPLPRLEKTWYGATRCAPEEDDDLPDKDLPDDGSGGSTTPPGGVSPILIDLDGDGFRLAGLDQAVTFDLDVDGVADTIAWTVQGGDDAFLVLDRNGNGTIDDGQELFGNATRLVSGHPAGNGYVALREYDSPSAGGNGDLAVDAADAVWNRLQVWTDTNHDAVSQPTELRSLAAAGVHRVETRYGELRRTDRYGNVFRFKARALIEDRHGRPHWSTTYDVFFVREGS
jgi:hypothetical protein